MEARIREFVFREPDGRPNTLVMFSGSLVFFSLYAYYDILRDSPSVFALVMAVGFALSGIAESLPEERRRVAGGLRVTAVLLLLGLIPVIIFTPELVFSLLNSLAEYDRSLITMHSVGLLYRVSIA